MSKRSNDDYAPMDEFFNGPEGESAGPPKREKHSEPKTEGQRKREEFLQWTLYLGMCAILFCTLLRIALFIVGA